MAVTIENTNTITFKVPLEGPEELGETPYKTRNVQVPFVKTSGISTADYTDALDEFRRIVGNNPTMFQPTDWRDTNVAEAAWSLSGGASAITMEYVSQTKSTFN